MAGEPKDKNKDITDEDRKKILGSGKAREAAEKVDKRKKERQKVMNFIDNQGK